jgi:polar amino acid transport system substrate-binding protein
MFEPNFRKIVPVILLAMMVTAGCASAAKPELVVAIPLDIPPYVMQQASTGLAVDLASQALAGHSIRFVQMPWAELQTAVQRDQAAVSVGVQLGADDVYYSDNFITFANSAISKKRDALTIDTISDLGTHPILAWQNAYLELGDEFQDLFSPGAPQRRNYTEVADQAEQVRMYWETDGSVLVIDRSIFSHFSNEMGHSLNEAVFHPLFPSVTEFRVAFADAALRDLFNEGLVKLCADGSYAGLLRRYEVELAKTVCDD